MRGFLALSLCLFVCGCGSGPEFELPPPSSTRLPNAGDAPYYDKVNDLGFALLREMDTSKNVVFSPVSVAHTLAMLMHGSSNKAHDELLAVLGLTESNKDAFAESQRALLNRLNSIESRPMKTGSAVFAVWPVVFDRGFVEKMGKTYDGDVRKLGGATIEGKRLLDEWVRERSDGEIAGLDLGLSKNQQLLALSAAHFSMNWETTFSESERFFGPKPRTGHTGFMDSRSTHGFYRDKDFTAISVPFENGAFEFFAVMADEGVELRTILTRFDIRSWRRMKDAMKDELYGYSFPKITQSFEIDMVQALSAVGLSSLFSDDCNLRTMAIELERGHSVSRFVQRTQIRLGVSGKNQPEPEPIGFAGMYPLGLPFVADRPFLFAVVEENTGVICVMGVVSDPTKG